MHVRAKRRSFGPQISLLLTNSRDSSPGQDQSILCYGSSNFSLSRERWAQRLIDSCARRRWAGKKFKSQLMAAGLMPGLMASHRLLNPAHESSNWKNSIDGSSISSFKMKRMKHEQTFSFIFICLLDCVSFSSWKKKRAIRILWLRGFPGRLVKRIKRNENPVRSKQEIFDFDLRSLAARIFFISFFFTHRPG